MPSLKLAPVTPAAVQTGAPLFFYQQKGQTEGPFDLIEMAGHFRCSDIEADTPVRREADETWRPFHELPEFADAKEMSIEEIARHLEEKTQAQLAASPPRNKQPFLWIMMGLLICLVARTGIIAVLTSGQKPAPSPAIFRDEVKARWVRDEVKTGWVRTDNDLFSIECPVPMESMATDKPNFHNYKASFNGAQLSVEITSLPGDIKHRDAAQALLMIQEAYILKEVHSRILSQSTVVREGFQGLDLISMDGSTGRLRSRILFLVGRGKVSVAFVTSPPEGISARDEDLFIESFEPH